MADIFVSYASEDRERAKALAQALEQQGWSVWWDRVIPPGKQWADVIEAEITAARCVVVLWSKVSVKGDWVKKEARAGLRRRILVPALVEPADIPFEFEDIQAADLIGWPGELAHPELRKLCAAIAEHAGPPPVAVRAREEAEARATAEAEAQARREREAKAREEEAQEAARREKEAREQAERRARAEAEARAKAEAEVRAKAEAEARAKAEAEAQAKREREAKARAEREVRERARQEAESLQRAEAEARAKAEAEATARAEEQVRAQAEAGRRAQADAGPTARKEVRAPAEPEMLSQEKPRTSSAGRWLLAGVAAVILLGVLSFWDAAQEKRRTEQTEAERQATEEKAARARRAEEEAWALAERADTRAALRDYLGKVERREIPGIHEGDALKRLQELERVENERKAAAEARAQAEREARLKTEKEAKARADAEAAARAREAELRAQEERKAAEAKARVEAEARAKAEAFVPGKVFRDCPDCPEMVVIPAGSFVMGSPEQESGRGKNEGPQHKVTIARPFAVGKYEVTFDEYDACVSAGGCKQRPTDFWGRGRQPVVDVNWDDARHYVAWLSKKTRKPYRLLSEAEWEYAARAGTTTVYPWGNEPGMNRANFGKSGSQWSRRQAAPVGSFKSNAFGLHDMIGNVFEWVQDCANGSYAGAPSDGSAWEAGNCDGRVVRGGSWDLDPEIARVTSRLLFRPGNQNASFGFRVARTL